MSTWGNLQIYPGRGLGFMTLGSSLHEILTTLKSQAQDFPGIEVYFSQQNPLREPVVLNLPENGFRLRFDGPDQRLKLIEVLDFGKTQLQYDGKDLVKAFQEGRSSQGPAFRQIYDRLFGPTFPGEFVAEESTPDEEGVYILSYPGIAFSFPMRASTWTQSKDFVAILSSPSASSATSLGIFDGNSWQEARRSLFERPSTRYKTTPTSNRPKEGQLDEVEQAVIRPGGSLTLLRQNSPPFELRLGFTTPQDLITELGPPDAIYTKSDRRLSIHKRSRREQHPISAPVFEESTDTDQSSNAPVDEIDDDREFSDGNVECFYNYYRQGLDVFLSLPESSSQARRDMGNESDGSAELLQPDQLVVTKALLHGNIPGSYEFNRYRRCRWRIEREDLEEPLHSELPFSTLLRSSGPWQAGDDQGCELRGMVLNRGWGNSPGSSIELLGGMEESSLRARKEKKSQDMDLPGQGKTELFGFPGLIFEVMENDTVSCVTIY